MAEIARTFRDEDAVSAPSTLDEVIKSLRHGRTGISAN
jgi:hypothetical protein